MPDGHDQVLWLFFGVLLVCALGSILGLACAEEVEVGSVEDPQGLHRRHRCHGDLLELRLELGGDDAQEIAPLAEVAAGGQS